MKRWMIAAGVVVLAVVISMIIEPVRIAFLNTLGFVNQKVDDATSYETIKTVEDTCRAMIASYEADKLTYDQYNGSAIAEQQSWADQAKMRANKTASSYNNYILKNSFVWAGNVPEDIRSELAVIP